MSRPSGAESEVGQNLDASVDNPRRCSSRAQFPIFDLSLIAGCADVIITSGHYTNSRLESTIPEGETRYVIIHCFLSKVIKSKKRVKLYLAVEDQLENKHKLPPVLVSPMPTAKVIIRTRSSRIRRSRFACKSSTPVDHRQGFRDKFLIASALRCVIE